MLRAAARCVRVQRLQCRGRGMASEAATDDPPALVERTWAGRILKERPLGDLFEERLEYRKQVIELRRKYRDEVARQRAANKEEEEAEKERERKVREEKLMRRRIYKEEVRLRHQEECANLRVILEEQRLRRAESFKKAQASAEERKDKIKCHIRQTSCSWIEEKDLEMRILESMVDPIHLVGSQTPPFESFESISSISRVNKVKEDPLLRDSDDELLSAFSKRTPRVTGQDILASVSKATKLHF